MSMPALRKSLFQIFAALFSDLLEDFLNVWYIACGSRRVGSPLAWEGVMSWTKRIGSCSLWASSKRSWHCSRTWSDLGTKKAAFADATFFKTLTYQERGVDAPKRRLPLKLSFLNHWQLITRSIVCQINFTWKFYERMVSFRRVRQFDVPAFFLEGRRWRAWRFTNGWSSSARSAVSSSPLSTTSTEKNKPSPRLLNSSSINH